MANFLEKILENTRGEIELRKKQFPADELKKSAEKLLHAPKNQRFNRALKTNRIEIIAEIKKASPSRGIISADFDPAEIAKSYEAGGAAAISVLTDEKFFQGKLSFLDDVSRAVNLPLLRKDFILDEYQIYEAAFHKANAILLLAVALSCQQIQQFIQLAAILGLDAVVEVHDADELEKALDANAAIIGVNNRNLKTFEVDLSTSLELAHRIPGNVLRVSESGIFSYQQVGKLSQAGFDAVLIGESLMRQSDKKAFLQELRGEKCG